MVNWLEGPGSEQLRAQWGIGDSIRASQALQQKHEEIESQHSVSSFPSASHSVVVFVVVCVVSVVPGWTECWVLACSRRWYIARSAYVERLGVWKYPWRLKIDSLMVWSPFPRSPAVCSRSTVVGDVYSVREKVT